MPPADCISTEDWIGDFDSHCPVPSGSNHAEAKAAISAQVSGGLWCTMGLVKGR